jgi:toxin FitB
MIILDTNVLSALMRHSADKKVFEWLDKQPRTSIWTTSITILEIRYGLQILPAGKRRSAFIQTFEEILVDKIERRIAPLIPSLRDKLVT